MPKTDDAKQKRSHNDGETQWGQAGNIWHNAAVRTGLYLAATPLRWVRGLFQ